MKIKKSRLKAIILEEIENFLKEAEPWTPRSPEEKKKLLRKIKHMDKKWLSFPENINGLLIDVMLNNKEPSIIFKNNEIATKLATLYKKDLESFTDKMNRTFKELQEIDKKAANRVLSSGFLEKFYNALYAKKRELKL